MSEPIRPLPAITSDLPRLVAAGRRPRTASAAGALLVALLFAAAACSSGSKPSSSVAGTTATPTSAGGGAGATAVSVSAAPVVASSVAGANIQEQMVAVIEKVNPSVVLIETSEGLGSGIVYDGKGDIVTNAHVAGTATTFKVTTIDGKIYDAKLVGSYPPDDIAVINVSGANLRAAAFGDSSKLHVGDIVLAMGNPLGLQSSVTDGIVSALGRKVTEEGGNALPDTIQTSASINPGNSGGALVDLNGQVVGIPTLAASDPQMGGAAPGIGFAISSNRAKTIADQIIQSGGKITNSGRPYLGVTLADTNGQGVLIYDVVANGPAEKGGIVPGDIVTAVAGQETPDAATLTAVLGTLKAGDTVKVDVVHQDGTSDTLQVTLGQNPG